MRQNIRLFLPFALLLISSAAYSQNGQAVPEGAKVETVQFKSKMVGATLPYHVVLPAGYRSPDSRKARYPVVYLLHGFDGHSSSWLLEKSLTDWATRHRIIIVTPEGNNGWYTDSATVATDKYESYIVRELIPEIQRRYRTIAARRGRSVIGFSMGGYGALKFGLKHPGRFSFAASLAGPMTIATWSQIMLKNMGALGRSIMDTFGPVGSETRSANDLFTLVRELSPAGAVNLPYLYLACGDDDPVLDGNRAMAHLLLSRRVRHEYHELPGGHDLSLYDEQLREVMEIAAQRMLPGNRDASPTGAKSRE